MIPNLSISVSLHAVEYILAIQLIVSSLELFSVSALLKDSELLSWRVNRLNYGKLTALLGFLGIEQALRYPNVLGLVALKLMAAVCLPIVLFSNDSPVVPLVILSLVNLLLVIRTSISNDGSDQMAMIILLTVTLAEASGTATSKMIGLGFISFQALLSYGTSGLLKQRKRGWHDGTYIVEILKTSSFGNSDLLVVAQKHAFVAKLLGILVVYGDSVLGISAFLPPGPCMMLLCFGVLMHIGIGMVLGLNTFLWSFGATYPAILWVSHSIYPS